MAMKTALGELRKKKVSGLISLAENQNPPLAQMGLSAPFRSSVGLTAPSVAGNRQQVRLTWCSLRDKGLSKKPLWRTAQDMSREAIQASRALKLASSDRSKLTAVFHTTMARLLKSDVLSLLSHLQRSDRCDLALKVFEHAQGETWYKPELALYRDMIYMLGRNKRVEEAENYFRQLQTEGLQPDSKVFTEMIGAYMEVGIIDKAMEIYGAMKERGCLPNELTFTILINNLVRFQEYRLLDLVKLDVPIYIREGESFLKNFDGKGETTCL